MIHQHTSENNVNLHKKKQIIKCIRKNGQRAYQQNRNNKLAKEKYVNKRKNTSHADEKKKESAYEKKNNLYTKQTQAYIRNKCPCMRKKSSHAYKKEKQHADEKKSEPANEKKNTSPFIRQKIACRQKQYIYIYIYIQPK